MNLSNLHQCKDLNQVIVFINDMYSQPCDIHACAWVYDLIRHEDHCFKYCYELENYLQQIIDSNTKFDYLKAKKEFDLIFYKNKV